MKRLLNTLYVTTQGAYISLKGENIVVHLTKDEERAFPIHLFDSVLCFGRISVTPQLMGFCAERGVPLTFYTESGRYLATVHGAASGNVLLRREQYRATDSQERSARIVKNILAAKINNGRNVLLRFLREREQKTEAREKFSENVSLLENYLERLRASEDLNEMRGIEGVCAKLYFDLFDDMIIQQKDGFKFVERNRRPPKDEVNAMLSFVYMLLMNDVKSALIGAGLDHAVGFLHKDRPGRASLALDMMEEFRSWWADRLVLSLINLKQIKKQDFSTSASGAVEISDEGRKTMLKAWQSRKQDELTHPYIGEKILMGQLPHIQAALLARNLRGDIKEYPPYVWR